MNKDIPLIIEQIHLLIDLKIEFHYNNMHINFLIEFMNLKKLHL